jgi:hypothetical protein
MLLNLAIGAVIGGAKPQGTALGVTTFDNIGNNLTTYNMLTYAVVADIIAASGEVLNYQSYIKVVLTDDVPAYIRDYQTIDNQEVTLTWADWIHANNPAIEIDGEFWISGYAHYAGFRSSEKPEKHLTGTELTALIAGGYTVINKVAFNALLED